MLRGLSSCGHASGAGDGLVACPARYPIISGVIASYEGLGEGLGELEENRSGRTGSRFGFSFFLNGHIKLVDKEPLDYESRKSQEDYVGYDAARKRREGELNVGFESG